MLIVVSRESTINQIMLSVAEALWSRDADYVRQKSGLRPVDVRVVDVRIANVEHLACAGHRC